MRTSLWLGDTPLTDEILDMWRQYTGMSYARSAQYYGEPAMGIINEPWLNGFNHWTHITQKQIHRESDTVITLEELQQLTGSLIFYKQINLP